MTRPSSAFLLAAAFTASLATAALAVPAPIDRSMVVQTAGGCGKGWHRGPNGGCRRNYKPGNRAPCPRGYYLNQRTGRCRANGT